MRVDHGNQSVTQSGFDAANWCFAPIVSTEGNQTVIKPRHVYVAWYGQRAAYARSPSLNLVDSRLLAASDLASRLSIPSSTSTDRTSALVGLVSKLSAMARAVRNRSYVLMAASSSDIDLRELRCMTASLRSKASLASFLDMSVSVFEIEHCEVAVPAVKAGLPGVFTPTVLLYAPQGSGKSTKGPELAKVLGCTSLIDEWSPGKPITPGGLHLTSERLEGGAA